MSGSFNIQVAIYDRLANYTPLTELLATYAGAPAIFDEVPQVDDPSSAATFPYVVLGHDTFSPWDTDTETGTEATVTIHTWSRTSDFNEAKRIMQQVYNALHRYDLDVIGFGSVGCDVEFEDAIRDPDGTTRHGLQRFRLVIDSRAPSVDTLVATDTGTLS